MTWESQLAGEHVLGYGGRISAVWGWDWGWQEPSKTLVLKRLAELGEVPRSTQAQQTKQKPLIRTGTQNGTWISRTKRNVH